MYLRSQMVPESGYLPVGVLCRFARVKALGGSAEAVVEAVAQSEVVEVSPDLTALRLRHGWLDYVFPPDVYHAYHNPPPPQ